MYIHTLEYIVCAFELKTRLFCVYLPYHKTNMVFFYMYIIICNSQTYVPNDGEKLVRKLVVEFHMHITSNNICDVYRVFLYTYSYIQMMAIYEWVSKKK